MVKKFWSNDEICWCVMDSTFGYFWQEKSGKGGDMFTSKQNDMSLPKLIMQTWKIAPGSKDQL